MKLTISEAAKLTGVSVRTLHYYDHIDLLKPDTVDEQSGYRYYGQETLARLQQILFYRELDFSLKEIGALLRDPSHDKSFALARQKQLLTLKKERLERLIALVDDNLKGNDTMNFNAFDQTDYETAKNKYTQEVRERWGHTEAYLESERRTAGYGKEQWGALNVRAEELFRAFADRRDQAPDSPAVQELVARWQAHITEHFYPCTKEILSGLGEMYTADERFQRNLDRYGAGTAALMSRAIAAYCAAR